jgi:hypothetical protein
LSNFVESTPDQKVNNPAAAQPDPDCYYASCPLVINRSGTLVPSVSLHRAGSPTPVIRLAGHVKEPRIGGERISTESLLFVGLRGPFLIEPIDDCLPIPHPFISHPEVRKDLHSPYERRGSESESPISGLQSEAKDIIGNHSVDCCTDPRTPIKQAHRIQRARCRSAIESISQEERSTVAGNARHI